jgi:Transposase DDE domain
VRSSRRLEREAVRNLEVLWLLRRLSPSFKTIADFRRDHPAAIDEFFSRDAFAYDAGSDRFTCPAGHTLVCRTRSATAPIKQYTTKACADCALKPQCTKSTGRVVTRDRYEEARQAMHQRALDDPRWMRRRRELAEHPFGIIKWMMGRPRFLVRGLQKAKAELAFVVLGFNLKRAIAVRGTPALLAALRAAAA